MMALQKMRARRTPSNQAHRCGGFNPGPDSAKPGVGGGKNLAAAHGVNTSTTLSPFRPLSPSFALAGLSIDSALVYTRQHSRTKRDPEVRPMKPTMNSKRGEKLQVLFGAFLVVTLSVSRSFGQDDRSVAVRPGFALRKTLPAAGISDPRLNLGEELQWSVSYAGSAAARSILSANQARPLSLAAADLNEDGVPDLLSGYAGGNGGVLALHLGNADSIYPNTPEAMRRKQAFSWSAGAQASAGNYAPAPFVSPARAFDLPGTPDFLGAGDFDADGHWDVVAAARGGFEIVVLHGNGQGDFG